MYSIWVESSLNQLSDIKEIIKILSLEEGKEYFDPHVTLVTNLKTEPSAMSVFNKIPYKIIEHLKYNPNVYLIINASSEGYLPYESFNNLNNWLLEKELKLDKTFFIHANYRISEYALDYKEK